MISSISSNAAPTQLAAPAAKTSAQKTTPKPQSGGGDTVQLSSAAQAMLAAIQESQETPTQTAQEADRGDPQAQRLLAREAAEKP